MSKHDHQMFPMGFLEHLIRHFNSVVGEKVFQTTSNKLNIMFRRFDHDDKSALISLLEKLVDAFKTIKNKYLKFDGKHIHIRVDFDDTETHYIITINGAIYIPPAKILNLFPLILWYYIRYHTGEKPSNSEKGRKLTKEWKEVERRLRHEINNSPKRLKISDKEKPCYLCGELGYGINEWDFKLSRKNQTVTMKSRVCKKHRTKVI